MPKPVKIIILFFLLLLGSFGYGQNLPKKLMPNIGITNQTPIKNLLVGETFTAGDFPIKILEISGASGSFSGKGYVIVPYLNDTKIAVAFENIKINTNYQLIDGVVETAYNENWANVQPIDPIIEEIFGPQTGEETPKSSEDSQDIADNGNNSESNNNTAQTGDDTNSDTDTQTSNNTPVADNTTETGNSQGATTGGNTTQNSANNTNNDSNTGTKVTENDYYIAYKGAKYYTGGMIKIPYQRNMNETFELGTLSDTTKVNFTIHQPGKQELWRGYTGDYKKTTIPIEDATLNNNLRVLDLFAEAYKTKGKPKVRISIEKVVTPFTPELTVKESNTARIAKAGETLYFVNKPNTRIIDFELNTKPNLDEKEIPKENIKWFLSQKELTTYIGKKIVTKVPVNDKISTFTISTTAGYPTATSKSVNVKWMEKDAIVWSFIPPAVSQVLTKSFEEIDGNLKKLDKYIKISNLLKFKIDPIKINGSKYNEEDSSSRFYKKMEVGSISGGISIESPEKIIAIPALQALSRAGIVDIGLYFKASFGVEVEGGVERYILAEQTNYKNNNPFLKIGPKGIITAGLKAELLIAKDQVQFDVRGGIEASLKGDINYDFSSKKLVGEIYFPPVILFADIHIETKGTIEFELVDFQKSIEITDKTHLYGFDKQF